MKHSVCIVADAFPPVCAVGAHRVAALCRHLDGRGWKVSVVTVATDPASENAPEFSKHVTVIRAAVPDWHIRLARRFRRNKTGPGLVNNAKPVAAADPSAARSRGRLGRAADWLSWWLHVPDSKIMWLGPAVVSALRQLRGDRPDVIFSSAPLWTSHLAGAALARLLRRPLVADFRDPWCGSAWRDIPYAVHRRIDLWMERAVVARARRIVCAWEGIRAHLVSRYPPAEGRIHTVLNGFDPALLDRVAPEPLCRDACALIHSGSFYGHRSPTPLLEALAKLRSRDPDRAAAIRMVLLGPTDYEGRSLEEMANAMGVADLVQVLPPVSHARALAMVKGAAVAMLFGQSGCDTLASIPAKVFEYIGAGKDVLAVGAGRDALAVLNRSGVRVWEASPQDTDGFARVLGDIVDQWKSRGAGDSVLPGNRLEFSQERMAREIEELLTEVIHEVRGMVPAAASAK